ncbi:hypothetical protein [Enterovirga rhinocerotis]|uniref:SPW repeat-containing protein n=1 Tax=Enterovirga rhinocerotis TaxID=1339210 RepID=A0A4R7C5G4_9HYPH|nr:hypothetical protein [Enterovirga rhinocerotis]TDR93132.1 hypothetical protein EV668_0386 [Enterovirga rhinocerotis]
MSVLPMSRFLRLALLGDAAASGATGILLAAGANFLEPLLGLPSALLRPLGLVLLPFAAFAAWLGMRESAQAAQVRSVVVVNALWVAGSAALLLWPGLHPTLLGQVFVAAQALAVAGFAVLQGLGLRGESPRPRTSLG